MRYGREGWFIVAMAPIAIAIAIALATPRAMSADADEPAPAETASTARPVDLDPLTVRRTWRQHWKDFAARCAEIDGVYHVLPSYDPEYASSAHITATDYRKRHTARIQQFDRSGRPTQRQLNEAPAEADAEIASHAIPRLAVGEYGYIHSLQIERIVDRRTLVGRGVWLVDTPAVRREMNRTRRNVFRSSNHSNRTTDDVMDIRFKARRTALNYQQSVGEVRMQLTGIDTRKLAGGMRWNGPRDRGFQIAIIGRTTDPQRPRVEHFVAVPADAFKRDFKEAAFESLLAERGLDVEAFCALVLEAKKQDRETFEARVLEALVLPPDDGAASTEATTSPEP